MEFDRFKSAWQKDSLGGSLSLSPSPVSRSFQWLRTSIIRDLQGSDQWSRLIFSFLFALVFVGASLVIMRSDSGRVVAWLFAAALLVDGLGEVGLLVRRRGEPAGLSMLDFIKREEGRVDARIRFERYFQAVVFTLAGIVVLLLVFGPEPVDSKDAVLKMGILTAFLAVAYRQVRSGSRARLIRNELRTYLKDLEG